MSEQTPVGRFLNEAPISVPNLLFDDAERPDNELLEESTDFREEYYQERAFLHSNLGKPTGAQGEDDANAGILSGTVLGDSFEAFHLFTSGEQLDGVFKAFSVASSAVSLAESIAGGKYLDPFNFLGGQLMGWMLEHVEPMRKALDSLAGNPGMVEAYSKSWENIAERLKEVASAWDAEVASGTAGWTGETALAYRTRAGEYMNSIGGLAALAAVLGTLNEKMGKLVEAVRGAIVDILSALAGLLVEVTIIILATVGTGSFAAAARATFGISAASLQVSNLLRKLFSAIFDLKSLASAATQAIAAIVQIEQVSATA
ncbi:WXG100 family type VII secretion target [Nocardia puris]|uniref:Outer membrane channel protein CpnT-like N-terminal domain-containing protein n=1 Tax=Nocardia puris TaxID=208602 RepID=A0A366DUQ7_9NOCA|nr:hypothetical protein [Nocardia puris]RBO93831.1 hypothetical protein DFR74_102250 [Nocardia puris]